MDRLDHIGHPTPLREPHHGPGITVAFENLLSGQKTAGARHKTRDEVDPFRVLHKPDSDVWVPVFEESVDAVHGVRHKRSGTLDVGTEKTTRVDGDRLVRNDYFENGHSVDVDCSEGEVGFLRNHQPGRVVHATPMHVEVRGALVDAECNCFAEHNQLESCLPASP